MAPARHHPQGFGRLTAQSWEIGMARMPAFVPDQDGTPMRPLLVMVMDGSGRIRVTQTCHPDQVEDALQRALQEAIERPASGCLPGLPEQVVVSKTRLLELLLTFLPGVNISLGPTPLLDQAMDSLREHFRVESPPGECLALSTYLTQDVTPEIVASCFEAAKGLYERSPWLLFPSDGHLFKISSTALGIRGWVGCVIGQNQQDYGVILFDSLIAYQHYVQVAADMQEQEQEQAHRPSGGFPRHRAINFEAKSAMPAALLKEIKRHHWPVAKGAGYPTIMLIEPDLVLAPPGSSDWRRLEGVARALVRLIDDIPDLASRWERSAPLSKRYRVDVAGQQVSVSIGMAGEGGVELGAEAAAAAIDPVGAGSSQGASGAEQGQARPEPKERVPAAMQAKVESLMERIDAFCTSRLNNEYRQLIHAAVCALARKRPSPLLTGREPSWAAGVVHAIGMANFLFDKSQTPHCKAPEIYSYFGVSNQTGQAHSKKVRDLLKIGMFDAKWTLPSQLDNSPIAWMLEVNGFILDIRTMPLEIQVEACAKGLIPYVPALRDRGLQTG